MERGVCESEPTSEMQIRNLSDTKASVRVQHQPLGIYHSNYSHHHHHHHHHHHLDLPDFEIVFTFLFSFFTFFFRFFLVFTSLRKLLQNTHTMKN